MKKVITILSVMFAIVITFSYIQLQQAKTYLTEKLIAQNLLSSPSALNIQWFPFRLVAQDLHLDMNKNWRIDVPYTEVKVNLSSVLTGRVKPEFIRFNQARLYSTQYPNADQIEQLNLLIKPTALFFENIDFSSIQQLDFMMEGDFIYKKQPYHFATPYAKWLTKADDLYQFYADKLIINQAIFEQVAMQFTPLQFYFRSLQGNVDFYRQQNGYAFVGKNIDIYTFWGALDIRSIISGRGALSGAVQFENSQLPMGELAFEIKQGTINGINLLTLASQHFPINYDEQRLEAKQMNTHFENANAVMLWDQQRLLVKRLNIESSTLILTGNGKVGLIDGQCDFYTQLKLNNSKYQQLNLPIHFFGDCHSPQYKVHINKELRNQLKEMIKQRLR